MTVRLALIALRLLDPRGLRRRLQLLVAGGGVLGAATAWVWCRAVGAAPDARARARVQRRTRRTRVHAERRRAEHDAGARAVAEARAELDDVDEH